MRTIFLILLLGFQSFSGVRVVSASLPPEGLESKLNQRVTNYNLGVLSFVEALAHVSTDFKIPMGIVWVETPATRANLTFAWRDATVLQIIQAIAKTQAGYEVKTGEGIVHVSLPTPVPERANFLTLKLKSFEVRNQNPKMAELRLHDLITPPRYGGISIATDLNSKVTIEMKDTSVQSVLDALALAATRKIWIVTFSNDSALTSAGLRRTISLWTGVAPPDKDQPVWDLLQWGDELPPFLRNGKQQ